MIWDRVACVYDLFANVINRKANKQLCNVVADHISTEDNVLECACGTGLLSDVISRKCRHLTATDYSMPMLKKAMGKLDDRDNITFEAANILQLAYRDENFDTVVAANVIHLLDEPYKALNELKRVCKTGGTIIIPTYLGKTETGKDNSTSAVIGKWGVNFKRKFTMETYQQFFADAGYTDVSYFLCKGKIPCAVAVLKK